jgi:hypothetical protein
MKKRLNEIVPRVKKRVLVANQFTARPGATISAGAGAFRPPFKD